MANARDVRKPVTVLAAAALLVGASAIAAQARSSGQAKPSAKPPKTTTTTTASTTTTVKASGGLSFGAPKVVSGIDAGEPGIDSAADGTLYVNAPAALLSNVPGSPSYVWRSDDHGANWKLLPAGMRENLPGGGDSDISVDQKTGALYMTDLWIGSATVSSSTDKGETWTANPLQGTLVQDRQWIATSGSGVVYHATHQIPSGLVVSKSVDGGLTFPVQSVAATPVDQTGCICPPGNLIAEGDGASLGTADKVGLVYALSIGGVGFAKSADGGLTWTNVPIWEAPSSGSSYDTTQAFPVVANAGGGHLVAVWQVNISGNKSGSSQVWMSRSSDWGSTWSAPTALVTSGTSLYPWVDARGSRVVVSLYHTSTAAPTPDSVPESALWYEKALASGDGGATWSGMTVVDPTSVKSGPICTGGTSCSGDRELLDFQQVVIDPLGKANLSYTRSIDGASNTEIRFAREA